MKERELRQGHENEVIVEMTMENLTDLFQIQRNSKKNYLRFVLIQDVQWAIQVKIEVVSIQDVQRAIYSKIKGE